MFLFHCVDRLLEILVSASVWNSPGETPRMSPLPCIFPVPSMGAALSSCDGDPKYQPVPHLPSLDDSLSPLCLTIRVPTGASSHCSLCLQHHSKSVTFAVAVGSHWLSFSFRLPYCVCHEFFSSGASASVLTWRLEFLRLLSGNRTTRATIFATSPSEPRRTSTRISLLTFAQNLSVIPAGMFSVENRASEMNFCGTCLSQRSAISTLGFTYVTPGIVIRMSKRSVMPHTPLGSSFPLAAWELGGTLPFPSPLFPFPTPTRQFVLTTSVHLFRCGLPLPLPEVS